RRNSSPRGPAGRGRPAPRLARLPPQTPVPRRHLRHHGAPRRGGRTSGLPCEQQILSGPTPAGGRPRHDAAGGSALVIASSFQSTKAFRALVDWNLLPQAIHSPIRGYIIGPV